MHRSKVKLYDLSAVTVSILPMEQNHTKLTNQAVPPVKQEDAPSTTSSNTLGPSRRMSGLSGYLDVKDPMSVTPYSDGTKNAHALRGMLTQNRENISRLLPLARAIADSKPGLKIKTDIYTQMDIAILALESALTNLDTYLSKISAK